jgi:pyruvate/2-oxoglutarate dehydrogenase complex dihydrolipoamide acyltransferase (E2) component
MSKERGRSLPISPFRQLVIDLMEMSRQVPSVCADRRMDLSPIVAARAASIPRPTWSAIFSKAFALLGRDHPELRRSYVKLPWPRFYEHPHNIASLNVEREHAGEKVIVYCLIRNPEKRSIAQIDDIIRRHKTDPIENLRDYQRSLSVSRIPWPFRRWFWWAALNLFGRRRCHNFGTFGISSVGGQGAGLLHLTPILTSTLHFGLFDEHNRLDVRLSWDHRVFDGALVASVLRDLESILNNEIVRELSVGRRAAA